MPTVSVKLPPALSLWLRKRSKEVGRTPSDLIRRLLENEKLNTQKPKGKSCGELLAELGEEFDGPADLSTNPRYLEDYGRE